LVMGLYFFLADKKRSVEGARCIEEEVIKSVAVWVVWEKVNDLVSGGSQSDK
jgi:hypothetical protein